jgi:hypothetical protein
MDSVFSIEPPIPRGKKSEAHLTFQRNWIYTVNITEISAEKALNMFAWLKKIFGTRGEDDRVKSFYQETDDLGEKDFRFSGIKFIPTEKIVGSVGRAHELDKRFNYRKRANTGRYRRVAQSARDGKPMNPIQVVRLKRDPKKDTQFFVMDGHHRVAYAKKRKFPGMNAEVTDVVLPDEEASPEQESGEDTPDES